MQYGGNDACRAVGRGGNDASMRRRFSSLTAMAYTIGKSRVLTISVSRRTLSLAASCGARRRTFNPPGSSPSAPAAFDALFHNLGNGSDAAADFGFAASGKRGFVCQHDFGDVEPVQTASGKQPGTTVVRIRNGFFRFRLPLEVFFGNDKAAADRIINLFLQYRAV